jgi:quinol monooxygenase YgiN
MTIITRHLAIATDPNRALELERLWRQEIAPVLLAQSSCQRVVLLRNRERPGEYVGVTEWQGQTALSAYMAGADFSQVLQLLQRGGVAAHTLTTFETVSD